MEIRTLSIKPEDGNCNNNQEEVGVDGNGCPILYSPMNHSLIIEKLS